MSSEGAIAELPIGASGPDGIVPPVLFDCAQTVISQYANSPILVQLIENMTAYIDPTINLNTFYSQVWDIDTAQGYGLDVWGRILGVQRTLHVSIGQYLGFEEAADTLTFGSGAFFNGQTLTENFSLSDTVFRRLLIAKAISNITDGSIASINQILINLFVGYGNCYVTDGEDMTMTYTFGASLSPVDLAIVSQSGVLPKPAGVTASVVQL